jgi:hypothetical protein
MRGDDAYTVRDAKGEVRAEIARRALRCVRSPAAHSAGLWAVPGTGPIATLRLGDAVVVRERGRCDCVQRRILLPALVAYSAALVAVRFGCALAVPLALGDAWSAYLGVERIDAPFVSAPLAAEAVALCFFAWCAKSQRETAALKAARYAAAAAAARASQATPLSPASADAALALAVHADARRAAAPVATVKITERFRRSEFARSPFRKFLDSAARAAYYGAAIALSIAADQIAVIAIVVLFVAGMYRIDVLHSVYVATRVGSLARCGTSAFCLVAVESYHARLASFNGPRPRTAHSRRHLHSRARPYQHPSQLHRRRRALGRAADVARAAPKAVARAARHERSRHHRRLRLLCGVLADDTGGAERRAERRARRRRHRAPPRRRRRSLAVRPPLDDVVVGRCRGVSRPRGGHRDR